MALARWTPGAGLTRWSPERELQRLRTEMDRLFEDLFGDGVEGRWQTGMWAPPVDLYDTDEAIVLKAELPGLSKDDIQVDVQDRMLTLRGERKQETEAKEERYHRRERSYGSFQRSFSLPTTVEAEKIEARFKNGILEVRIPKSETAKPRRISIAEGQEGGRSQQAGGSRTGTASTQGSSGRPEGATGGTSSDR